MSSDEFLFQNSTTKKKERKKCGKKKRRENGYAKFRKFLRQFRLKFGNHAACRIVTSDKVAGWTFWCFHRGERPTKKQKQTTTSLTKQTNNQSISRPKPTSTKNYMFASFFSLSLLYRSSAAKRKEEKGSKSV
jgi:hypothetical protein